MHREQLALDQVRLLRLAQADGAIGMAHVHVQLLVVEDQLHLHVGVKRQEFLDLVGQPALAEADGGGDAQLAEGLSVVSVSWTLTLSSFIRTSCAVR